MVMSSSSIQIFSRSSLSLRQFGLGQLAHVGIGAFDHLHGFADLLVELLEVPILRRQLGQRAMLAVDGRRALGIGQHLGIDKQPLQLLESLQLLVERIRHGKGERGEG